ncbi:CATRA conflict system CASPASE/TPR repeat-associated protein [Saccharothrix sp. Mg75]|uniref:CATRA conflict system CASPASE/TPR repeat-associated protein n=1 Tax=Saccharothrix sp. Mg75 TaxID=3445357 RepID=UPI003EEB961C
MLLYAFASLDGGRVMAEQGWQQLDQVWRACREAGSMTAPLLSVDAPEQLPAVPTGSGPFRIVASAARATAGRIRSMFVFAEHGTAGLVAAISADDDGERAWADLIEQWHAVARPDAERNGIGRVTVLLGLSPDSSALDDLATVGNRLARKLGVHADLPLADPGPAGALLWELRPSFETADRHRTLVIAAPEHAEDTVDEWIWTADGHQGLVPLVRYCLNIYRAGHQRRVHEAQTPLPDLVADTDTAVTGLASQLASVGSPSAAPATVLATDDLVQQVQLATTKLLWRQTKIREMATTTRALHVNARRNRPAPSPIPGGMFARDDTDLAWFVDQLDREATYLDALIQRATTVNATAANVTSAVTTRRRDRITLLQTSFLGALLMALAAIQSFQYTTSLNPALKGPVIGALAAAAFGLPVLVARWSGLVPRTEAYRWLDLVAATCFGAALGWLVSSIVWMAAAERLAPPVVTGCAVALGALLVLTPTWLISRRRMWSGVRWRPGRESGGWRVR